MQHGVRLALAASSLLAALALIPAAAASAAPAPAPSSTLVNGATGNCLDSNAQYQIYDLPCNGGNYQKWISTSIVTADGKAAYVIVDAQTGFCLDGNDGGAVYTHDCLAGDTYQEWVPTAQNNTLTFVSDHTGRALQADPGINAVSPDGTSKQQWNYTVIAVIPAT